MLENVCSALAWAEWHWATATASLHNADSPPSREKCKIGWRRDEANLSRCLAGRFMYQRQTRTAMVGDRTRSSLGWDVVAGAEGTGGGTPGE